MIIVLIWLTEILDIPYHLLGAPATPVNWRESIIESFFVIVRAIPVIRFTRRAIARVRYLEAFLLVCASCKRVKVGDAWEPFDVFLRDHSNTMVSHGLCPICAEQMNRVIPPPRM